MILQKRSILAALAAMTLASFAAAEPIVLKFASQAPENTPVGSGLAQLASDFKRVTNGEVTLRVFNNSSQGDEASMRQKMDTGLLDGAVFDTFGLSHISPEMMAICAPAVIRDRGELDYILKKTNALSTSRIEEKGYKVLGYASVGWVHFFSRYTISNPDDLRKYRIAVNPYEKELMELYKLAGLNIVLAPSTTMLQQLQAKSVDIFYTTPMYLSYQWTSYQSVANHMTELKVCPVVGGIVLRKKSWDKIPAQYQQAIMDATANVAMKISDEFMQKEDGIVNGLTKYGLTIVPSTEAENTQWRDQFAEAVAKGTGKVFPKDMIDLINQSLAEYRGKKK
jgi:TRAP-type C4-dicarboxylate transport system substrate-binding protein